MLHDSTLVITTKDISRVGGRLEAFASIFFLIAPIPATRANRLASAAKGDQIRKVARKLGCRPDWRARTLRIGKTNTVCIAYSQSRPLIDMTTSDRLFRKLGDVLASADYNMIFVHVPPHEGRASLPGSILQTTDAAVF